MVIDELVLLIQTDLDKKKLSDYNKKVKQTEKGLAKTGKKYDKFALSTKERLGKGLKQFAGQLPFVGSMIDDISAKNLKLIATIGAVVIAVKGISAATKQYVDFEKGMKGVQRVTLATAGEMKKLKKNALENAEVSVYTASQTADAQKFLAQAGLNLEQVMGALPATLQLAAAADMDLARASDISTDIMSAQGMAVSDLTRINDSLVKGATLATTSVAGLGGGMAALGVEARNSAIEMEEATAVLGVLASAGQKNEQGGTFFRNLLGELRSGKAKKAMTKVGIDYAKYLNEATGEYTNFSGLIAEFSKLDKIAINTFKTGAFAEQSRGKRAFGALVLGSDKLLTNLELIKNASGVAEQASKVAFQGLSGQVELTKSQMNVAGVNFMEDSSMGSFFAEIVEITRDTLVPIFKTVGVLLKPVFKALTLALKPVKIFVKILGGSLKILANILNMVWDFAFGILPIAEIFDRISNAVDLIFQRFNNLSFGNLSSLSTWFEDATKAVGTFWDAIIEPINPILEMLDLFLNWFLFDMPEAGDMLSAYWDGWTKEFGNQFKSVLNYYLLDPIKKFFNYIDDHMAWIRDLAFDGDSIFGKFAGFMREGAVENATPINPGFNPLQGGVSSTVNNVANNANSKSNSVGDMYFTVGAGESAEETASIISSQLSSVLAGL